MMTTTTTTMIMSSNHLCAAVKATAQKIMVRMRMMVFCHKSYGHLHAVVNVTTTMIMMI